MGTLLLIILIRFNVYITIIYHLHHGCFNKKAFNKTEAFFNHRLEEED